MKKLKKEIVYKYNSQAEYARQLNISKQNLNEILNKKKRSKRVEEIIIKEFNLQQNFFEKS